MATLWFFCWLLLFLFLFHSATCTQFCDTMSCGGIGIQFPFGLKGFTQIQGRRCSYPNFQLSCDNQSQTILTLPQGGDLVVKSINYESQTIMVNDPNHCLPNRFLHNLTLSVSPFEFDPNLYHPLKLNFLRCPSNFTNSNTLPPIPCLNDPGNNNNSSVTAAWPLPNNLPAQSDRCEVISSAMVPIPITAFWPLPDLSDDYALTWRKPRCGDCIARGEACGFVREPGLKVGCSSSPQKESRGLARSVKYGLIIGVGIPGLLCIVGLSCFLCGKIKMYAQRRQPTTELPMSIALRPVPFVMGLDGPTIEKYPKTLLGESGRLPKPSDNACPICLSEYQPKETLRTIPECNHYFHADCIDQWLKMNATCPLCRNSPQASSAVTPSSLSTSSSFSFSP